ncbi:high-affinity branched-chain amino acid ABC transporter substrate-binding protein [Eoetvoesiella caeni]|uniref:L-leucine-binding protein /L-isoleucine-binding protein /L-valine-binding protein n=1 Tax=Eoetvoesiella caeni TaxID=645616 RepID=A0A366HDX6_9BURK|nr:high-affinity branched-chain amino acid ABC transporter substrate-binding protein [Eoetvoesiella caeni]MCI2808783.1 high-affinity branched-chain amino acid ABC transporter substrate-binding protein [Eoetvoesiella caeni]NYT55324.1 high-affinity branched-chain amino acid ABC transporter substrate-binding protein [Eoetvoesiella caeni]RBP40695.1 L-leucine-binding protein /L-isoleucine-binding protein /L-valine-binding protein [Eoetvoesiella caeni]
MARPLFRALALLAGCILAVGARAEPLRIAVVGPLTGPVTQYGSMVRQGVDTAIERINAAGGVLGRQLEVAAYDDGCESKQGPIVANRVVNDGIQYVVGPVCSGPTIAAAAIYNTEGVVMVTPSATAPAVTQGKHYESVFRTIGRDDQQGPAAAEFIAESIKPKKVAVLHDKQSYGFGIASAVKKGLEQAGIDVALFEGINAGDSDYSAIITRIKSSQADFVYFGGYHPEMGLLLRQGAEQGLKVQFMGPEGVGNPDINAIAGAAAEGMLITLPADLSSDPANAAITKAFRDKQRDPGGAFQLPAYAAVQVLADSIRAVGADDPIAVAAWMHAHSFKTPLGEIAWDEQGDLRHFRFDVFRWHQDGTKTLYK